MLHSIFFCPWSNWGDAKKKLAISWNADINEWLPSNSYPFHVNSKTIAMATNYSYIDNKLQNGSTNEILNMLLKNWF